LEDCTLTLSADGLGGDPAGRVGPLQRLDRRQLKIDGDMTLMLQIEEAISKLSK